ncbi:MAG: hypothetical protein ACE5JL_00815 [Dehalococcoidia bacterium]
MKDAKVSEVLALIGVMSFLFSYSIGLVMVFFHVTILRIQETAPITFGWHWLRDSTLGHDGRTQDAAR